VAQWLGHWIWDREVVTGIPWVPWDSHANGNTIIHGMRMVTRCMRMGMKSL